MLQSQNKPAENPLLICFVVALGELSNVLQPCTTRDKLLENECPCHLNNRVNNGDAALTWSQEKLHGHIVSFLCLCWAYRFSYSSVIDWTDSK